VFVADQRWVFGALDGAGKVGSGASWFTGGSPHQGGLTLGSTRLRFSLDGFAAMVRGYGVTFRLVDSIGGGGNGGTPMSVTTKIPEEEPDGFLGALEVVYDDGTREVVSIKRVGMRQGR